MGKIILEFDSVEESQEAATALDGWKWKMAMWDLDQKLRTITKYAVSLSNTSQEATSEEIDFAEKIREELRDILNTHNLNLVD
jgi:hypothetical protein